MKLKRIKIILTSIILGISCIANADNLNISNSLSNDISFKIKDSCSREFGVIKMQSIKVIPEADFIKACSYGSQMCQSEIYNSADCNGSIIAFILFDTKYGVRSIQTVGDVKVIGNGFNLFFEDLKK